MKFHIPTKLLPLSVRKFITIEKENHIKGDFP